MANTVNSAFKEFMDTIRLDSSQTEKAKKTRDNLISNINSFSGDDDFFVLSSNRHLKYGSFARKTKIRPLDDIDLMICISCEGERTYYQNGDTFCVIGSDKDRINGLLSEKSKCLNSTKVINRFIQKMNGIYDYNKAEMHKNHEAATLQLKSYDWNFDIVPCFYMDIDKYLIPDGKGNWKLTDPRIDNNRTIELNKKHKGNLLDIIRIMKYWNKRNITYTISSYLLECMILEEYEGIITKSDYWIDCEFIELLKALSDRIMFEVYDPKEIQGNLNELTFIQRSSISEALRKAYDKAYMARSLESKNEQEKAISKWKEVLGENFPDYS